MKAVAKAMLKVAKIIDALPDPEQRRGLAEMVYVAYVGALPSAPRAPMSGAERAKSYRDRHRLRNDDRDVGVTPSVTERNEDRHGERDGSVTRFLSDSPSVSSLLNKSSKAGKARSKGLVTAYSPGFEAFWAAYPKRVAKDDAARAWQKLGCESLANEIVFAVKKQRDFLMRTDANKAAGDLCPYPATWLNGGRWKDESVSHPAPPSPSPPGMLAL